MARIGQIFFTLMLIGALSGVAATGWFMHEIKKPGPLANEKLLYIEPGSSLKAIAGKLRRAGIIEETLPFLVNARFEKRNGDLQAGEYQFAAGISIGGIVQLLQSGKTYQHKITIPEGLMSFEIIDLLKNETALLGDVAAIPAEGSLLPETYNFTYGDTKQMMVERMQKAMRDAIQAAWEKRAADLPLKSPEEAVTLASIVEKETGLAAERPRVAGVFVNRLRKHIPLQSDPTVIYAVTEGKERLDRSLTLKDLKSPSPYNTYMAVDLPPTPIANPGKASLEATLNPEQNDFIYFVADGTGGHAFARTLKEHNQNVARWRIIEKKQNSQ